MCQCKRRANGSVIVCEPCVTQRMMTLLGLSEQDAPLVEKPVPLPAPAHRGVKSAVNHWLDTLEVAKK